jgi:uncharacterized MAPEG superfamily protein
MTTADACVLAAALLPLLFTGIAKFAGRGFDNRAPREFQARLAGFPARAHWAHLNSIEAFAPFAAAVIIAQQLGAAQARVDLLALSFIGFRLAYGALYLANRATLRSLAWSGGLACVIALFFAA